MIVKELNIQMEKGKPVKSVKKIKLIEDHGVEGDIHAKGGNRQVIILDEHTKSEINSLVEEGLCLKKFYGNIIIESLDFNRLTKNCIIQIGNTKINITQIGKRCFPECNIVKKGKSCILSKKSIFGAIIAGGQINIDDNVKITNS